MVKVLIMKEQQSLKVKTPFDESSKWLEDLLVYCWSISPACIITVFIFGLFAGFRNV